MSEKCKGERNKEEVETRAVTSEEFASHLKLETVFKGRGEITVSSISVSRPGLQLAGYFEHFDNKRVQVVGSAEHEFLKCLPAKVRRKSLDELFGRELPCLIVARNLEISADLENAAKKYNCPLYRSDEITTVLIHDLMIYLNDLLAPTLVVHGVLLDISGVGVLITGNAGIGKSETALELISRGHRLVADDTVVIKNTGELLVGTCPHKIQYYMEVRGIGIINVKTMFGPGAIRPEKTIEIVAELVPWDDSKEYDRLGDQKITTCILGKEMQKLVIPVSPGRNIPIIIETAARKFRLEEMGYSAIDELLNATFTKPVKGKD